MEDNWLGDVYQFGAVIVGILAFLGLWIYSMDQWGVLIGLLIGWLPALIGAAVIGLLWPLGLIAGVILWNSVNQQNKAYEAQKVNNIPKQRQCIEDVQTKRSGLYKYGVDGKTVPLEQLNRAAETAIRECKIDYPI